MAVTDQLVKYGYAPDPSDYELDSDVLSIIKNANINYAAELKNIINDKGYAIELFSMSSNQARGILQTPRIVIDTQYIQPGELGGDTSPVYVLNGNTYIKQRNPSLTSDYTFNVFAVASNVKQMRTLISILLEAFPRRGYIKSYLDFNLAVNNNIFINFIGNGDTPNLEEGIIEKYYSFEIKDIFESLPQTIDASISKISTITLNQIKIN